MQMHERIELIKELLNEAKIYIDKGDTIQSSEKLYKAVEECLKILVYYFDLKHIINRVKSRGRWSIDDYDEAAIELSKKIDKIVLDAWNNAMMLHVWGFHEGKLSIKSVIERFYIIEKFVNKVIQILETRSSS